MLDVGCGNSILYDHLVKASSPIRYAGIDLTPKYVEYAKKLYPDLDVRVGSALDLPFPDDSYDVVFCKDMLGHFPPDQWVEALREMWRVAAKRVIVCEFVFGLVPTRTVLDDLGFYQNEINLEELRSLVESLPRLEAWRITAVGLGSRGSSVYVLDKKRRREKQVGEPNTDLHNP